MIAIAKKNTVKRDCDSCRFLDQELFKKKNRNENPCRNPVIVLMMNALGDDFWDVYNWAKTVTHFGCKGFEP